MADSTLPPESADRNLLLGVLALQLEFLGLSDLQVALQTWGADRSCPLGQVLVERGILNPRRRALLEDLVREFLIQHDNDAHRGVLAACAARAIPLDIDALAAPALRGNLPTLPASPLTLPGSTIPPSPGPAAATPTTAGQRFRILRPHARGALGIVHLAIDEDLHREVALKEIQEPYHRSADSRERFVLEAEITGTLEHPGVVPVYALGQYADGRPYYAMRFIKGDSLHDAIGNFHAADVPGRDGAERRLALRGLLSRFIDVCNTIAYAHSRGVIHRDIKPANVMLGPYGETLVVDWGLAKALDRPCTPDSREIPLHPKSATATATMLGQAVGTPAFMPPEQAAGRLDDVGPASDIYSLGATLYTLLTGIPPFPGFDAHEVIKQVQTHDFPPPRKVKRQVPAALEAVVLKAMAFRPEGRYGSAAEVASEIECWLADEPVKAYPEPLLAKTRRWARRHRAVVGAALAVLMLTMVGLGLGLYFVGKERDQAIRNLNLAKDAVDRCFLVATEEKLLQKEKLQGVRKLLLKEALPYYRDFRSQRPNDRAIQQELARNLSRVAFITAEIDDKKDAIAAYELARDQFRQLARRYPDDENYRIDLAAICNNLAALLADASRRDEAMEAYKEARELREDLARGKNRPERRADLASTLTNLGVLLAQSGQTDAARDAYLEARAIQQALVDREPTVDRYRAELAATHHNLGQLLAEKREVKEAAAAYALARALREGLVRSDPESARFRAALADTLINQGVLFTDTAHPDEARKAYDEARKLYEALAAEFLDVAEYRSGLASSLLNLGDLTAMSQPEQALPLYLKADAIQARLVKDDTENIRFKMDLAGIRLGLAELLRDRHEFDEARKRYDQVIPLLAEVAAREPRRGRLRTLMHRAHEGRARTLAHLKRHKEALADWDAALKTATGDEQATAKLGRVEALAHLGEHGEAMKEFGDLEKDKSLSSTQLYTLGCVAGLSTAAAGRDLTLPAAQRDQLSKEYGVQAVGVLRRAWQAGVFADADMLAQLKKDGDLAALRMRPDFTALLAEVEKKPGGK